MDDKPNIVDNIRIQINNLAPSTLYQTFFANPGSQKKLYRPIPMLTFALNWYAGGKDPFGYHIINLLIHIITAFILFLTTIHLFATPALKGKLTDQAAFFISFLSVTLWAVNPIQTQAVTYIVQRMTVLATLFYLLGLLFYIKARLFGVPNKRVAYLLGCIFSFLFALGSKENSAVFPITLILVELIFFQKEIIHKFKSPPFLIGFALAIVSFFVLVLFFTKGDPLFFLRGYGHRTYDWVERLLAQSRVLVLYLSLIFYPLPQRLSIDHSIQLSSSPFEPWTTLPAILLLVFLLAAGIHQAGKRPLIGFPICFFFLNHIIESSVIPLEIVFEHRNYLPSAFLFLPVAAFSYYLLEFYRKKNRLVFTFLFFGLSSILFLFGISTYVRNTAWASKRTLWEDAAVKAPGNARPLVNLAIELGWKEKATQKDIETALELLHRAIPLYKPNNFHHAEIFSNIGGIHFRIQNYTKAIAAYEKSLLMDPFNILTRYNLVQSLILMQRWDETSEHLDFIIENGSGKFNYFNLKGFVLLWQSRPYEAIYYFREALKRAPDNASVLMNLGISLSHLASYKNAKWFLKRATRSSPDDIDSYFGLIENAVKSENSTEARKFAHQLLSIQNIDAILNRLNDLPQSFKGAPMSNKLIEPVVRQVLLESIDLLENDDQKPR